MIQTKRIFFSLIATLLLVLSGCCGIEYPSKFTKLRHRDQEPFYSLIGREVKLLRPVTVSGYSSCDKPDTVTELEPPIKYRFACPSNILGYDQGELSLDPDYESCYIHIDDKGEYKDKYYIYKTPEKFPEGTMIKFDSFWIAKDYAFFILYKTRYMAWFRVPGLNIPREIRFLYIWGKGRYLRRAPWEPDTVPEERYVGYDGKGYKSE